MELLLSDRILRVRDPVSELLYYRQVFDQAQVNYALRVLLELVRLDRIGQGTGRAVARAARAIEAHGDS